MPVLRSLTLCSLPLALLACAVERPDGSYEPRPAPNADAGGGKLSMADSDEDIYGEMNGHSDDGDDAPKRDAGAAVRRDGSTAVDAEASGEDQDGEDQDGEDQDGEDPGDDPTEQPAEPSGRSIVGDYWMRADVDTDSSVSALGLTIRTNTKSQVYSLVRIDEQGGQLTFRDYQCTLRIAQSCTSGCTSVSTTLLDPAKSGRAYVPAVRALTVGEDGRWSASRVPYALGWKGDFVADEGARLPTSDSDPLVYDPDGGEGKGVDITVRLKPSIVPERVCRFRVVQKIDVTYEGMLQDGAPRTGTMANRGSTQNVLETSCPDNEPSGTDGATAPIRLIAAPTPIDLAALPWPCPSLAEFDAAFR